MSTNTVYAVITDRIIQALETGTVPWRMPWRKIKPSSFVTGANYRGINRFMLELAAQINGYSSPYWLTFRQALAQGGNVKKGEKGWPCMFFKTIDKDDATTTGDTQDETKDGKTACRSRAIARYFTVFNLDQCEGVTAPALPDVAPFNPIEACESIVTGFEARGPAMHLGGNQACYIPSRDRVEIPLPQQFGSPENFYSTLFHELGHATGHPTRLARFETTAAVAAFGSESYYPEHAIIPRGLRKAAGSVGNPAGALGIIRRSKRQVVRSPWHDPVSSNGTTDCPGRVGRGTRVASQR
jgi:antirestriction protein ArdC